MDLFSPDFLPGVGMGDLDSVAAVCGLLGLAVTSGILVAEGAIGTVLFVASAVLVLQEKRDFGGSAPAAMVVLGFLLVAVAARMFIAMRTRRAAAALAGAAKDAPETKASLASVARREGWIRRLAIIAVIWAGASAGFAWAEWNEVPFELQDAESLFGLALGLFAAAVGGDAAWRFLQGAVRAGGSAGIVGSVLCVVAFLLNAASVYVPFVGGVVFLLALLLSVRLRRRQQQKYMGLRILS